MHLITGRLNSGDIPSRAVTVLQMKGQKSVASCATRCLSNFPLLRIYIFHLSPPHDFICALVLFECHVNAFSLYYRLRSIDM